MNARSNLISSPVQRANRKHQKQQIVLRHLRQHVWSSASILQILLGHQTRQATHTTLTQMESAQLIKRHNYPIPGGNAITLWGITAHGQAMAFEPETELAHNACFEPTRISILNIQHQLDLQLLHIQASKTGWNNWVDGDRLGNLRQGGKRPDAIATSPAGHITAIECERTIKATKRYQQILASYLRAIKAGEFHQVVWITPSAELAIRLGSIIKSIETVPIAGQKIAIDPARHHLHLHFTDYSNWPNLAGGK